MKRLRKLTDRDRRYLARIWGFARPYVWPLTGSLVLLLLLVFATNSLPILMQQAIDLYVTPAEPMAEDNRLAGLTHLCTWMGILATAMFLFRVSEAYLSVWIGQNVLRDMREAVFHKVLTLPMQAFDRTPIGRFMTRATSDLDALQDLIRNGFIGITSNVLLLIGTMGFMLYLEWRLALALFCTFPLLCGLLILVNIGSRRAQRNVRAKTSALNSRIHENLSGLFTLRLFGARDRAQEQFEEASYAVTRSRYKVIAWNSWHFPVIELLRGIAVVVLVGTWAILLPDSPGKLVAFLYYVRFFFRPLEELSEQSHLLQSGLASAERVFDLLDEDLVILDPVEPDSIDEFRGHIRFEGVHFAYPQGPKVIEEVSFTVEPGETCAIVGATGSGKTSLIRLLCRLYEVDQGQILVDGHDIRSLRQRDLRRNIGTVTQEPLIFSGSVLENITMGDEEMTRALIENAARTVNAHRFITELPEGYDTVIGEGGLTLSTGQKQLLALTRIMVQNQELLLILDEATAHVDSESEALIQEALDRVMSHRTTLVIAHRLSTIQHADKILVMHKGRIVEQGRHDDLLAADGYYRTLVEMMRHEEHLQP